jgi:4'-phosphopantetheinyl transferase EntD
MRPLALALFCDDGAPWETLASVLSPRECQQASELATKKRRQFVLGRRAAHAALERLGEKLPPGGWDVQNDSNGAPLACADGQEWLVSLSHSGRVAFAVAWLPKARRISWGVDVERVRPSEVSLSEWAFSKRERGMLARETDFPLAGLVAWSLKEAAWKALRPARSCGPETVFLENWAWAQRRATLRASQREIAAWWRVVDGPDGAYVWAIGRVQNELSGE